MEKVLEIDYTEGEGLNRVEFKGKVTMKRLNFSEKNALEEEATDIKVIGRMPQVKVSPAKMKEIGIMKSVVKTELQKTTYFEDRQTKNHVPTSNGYNLDYDGIRNLPQDIGNMLFETFTELNSVDEKKN